MVRLQGAAWFCRWVWVLGVLGLSACANQTSLHNSSELDSLEPVADATPVESVSAPVTELSRASVDEALKAGFGRFLAKVEVKASLDGGSFVGFRIVRFHDKAFFAGTGLLPGDIVTRVNGLPIERPEQGFSAFSALMTASYLEVDYLRDGHPMRLSLPIVGSSEPAPKSGKSGATAAAASSSTSSSPSAPLPAASGSAPAPATSASVVAPSPPSATAP